MDNGKEEVIQKGQGLGHQQEMGDSDTPAQNTNRTHQLNEIILQHWHVTGEIMQAAT